MLEHEKLPHRQAGLTLSFSSDIRSQLDALIASAKNDTSKLDRLFIKLEQIDQSVAVQNLPSQTRLNMAPLLQLSGHATDRIMQKHVLACLKFGEMNNRYEAVSEAHRKTLRWIFKDSLQPRDDQMRRRSQGVRRNEVDDGCFKSDVLAVDADSTTDSPGFPLDNLSDTSSNLEASSDGYEAPQQEYSTRTAPFDDPAKADARDRLRAWLQSGDGVFRFSGKLGSGKSTLMKYICEHPSTKALLEAWAGTAITRLSPSIADTDIGQAIAN